MKRDEIIRMAREAEATPYTNRHFPDRPFFTFSLEQLERFANLVAAAEREACAQDCMRIEQSEGGDNFEAGVAYSVEAIRARGQKDPT